MGDETLKPMGGLKLNDRPVSLYRGEAETPEKRGWELYRRWEKKRRETGEKSFRKRKGT